MFTEDDVIELTPSRCLFLSTYEGDIYVDGVNVVVSIPLDKITARDMFNTLKAMSKSEN